MRVRVPRSDGLRLVSASPCDRFFPRPRLFRGARLRRLFRFLHRVDQHPRRARAHLACLRPASRAFLGATGNALGRARLYRHGRHHLLGPFAPLLEAFGRATHHGQFVARCHPAALFPLLDWLRAQRRIALDRSGLLARLSGRLFPLHSCARRVHRQLSLLLSRCRGARLSAACG